MNLQNNLKKYGHISERTEIPAGVCIIRLNTLQSNEGISNMLLLSLIGTYAALVLLVSSFTEAYRFNSLSRRY